MKNSTIIHLCWGKFEMNWINVYHLYRTHEVGTNTVTSEEN